MTLSVPRAKRASSSHPRADSLITAARVALVAVCAITITVLFVLPVEKAAGVCTDPATNCMRTLSDGIYWTITTMTTTGYGDITPMTALGRAWAVALMIAGLLCAGIMVDAVVTSEGGSRGSRAVGRSA